MHRRLFIGSLLALLAGCATQTPEPHARLAGKLSPRAGKAYVVVSLTADTFQTSHTYLAARFSQPYTGEGLALQFGHSIQAKLGSDRIGEGDASVPGKLQLLELEPGRYEFSEATSNWPDPAGREPFSQSNRLPMRHSFEVQAGESVYLGEIRLQLNDRPQVSIIDAHERDFRHIGSQWKISDLSPLQIRLLQADQTTQQR